MTPGKPVGAAVSTKGGLVVHDVTHVYGAQRALDGVSLTVARGEVLCLLGPSGCGKSTLLRLAAGLEPLQTGRVVIAGRTVADARRALPPEARDVGMVFQDYALFPHLTVLENVAFGLHRMPRAARRARATDMLERVELGDRAGSYPHVLSGGEQQRVALARALASRPAAMLLDEPFAGLDTRLRQRVRQDSLRLLQESGAAVLLVTHDPEEAMALGDRLAVMRAGRIEHTGPPEEVYARPASAFVARFLGDTNWFRGTVAGGTVTTPLGLLPAGDHPEGMSVEVHVRPEALRLERVNESIDATPDDVVPRAVIDRVRRIGAQTVIELRATDHSGAGCRLRALQLGPSDLAPEEVVRLRLDRREALVFPLAPVEPLDPLDPLD
ncbi:MAG: ABC transporter ATP-binding protein, partial [Chloroflexota bacterium]|nr:ABC transporter ATP-binding protein [Chloroflexota bacterium]